MRHHHGQPSLITVQGIKVAILDSMLPSPQPPRCISNPWFSPTNHILSLFIGDLNIAFCFRWIFYKIIATKTTFFSGYERAKCVLTSLTPSPTPHCSNVVAFCILMLFGKMWILKICAYRVNPFTGFAVKPSLRALVASSLAPSYEKLIFM